MNVCYNLSSAVWALVFFLTIPILSRAQINSSVYRLETTVGETVSVKVSSQTREPILVGENGQNGIASHGLFDATSGIYEIFYKPNDGFVGKDTFQYMLSPTILGDFVDFYVTVNSSIVEANPDFSTTLLNTAVDIEVLGNDEGTSTNLVVSGIALSNAGTVMINESTGLLTFTPDTDYVGLAQFNYTVCDEFGSCDQSTVTVQVNANANPTGLDSVQIFTKKNQAQAVYIPADYDIINAPENGSYDWFTNEYVPDQSFVGNDEIIAQKGGHQIVVSVDVLDFEEIKYAVNDQIYTTPEVPIEFNVLDNDGSTSCFELTSEPINGTLRSNFFPIGSYTYIPDPEFTGVDEFTYRIKGPGCSGDFETATVRVHVSNYEPSSAKYFVITPKKTPIVIGYNIPVSNFGFEVKDQGELGQAFFLAGAVDTVIFGQPVTGNNIVLYVPNEEVITGRDEFEIEYCLSSGNGCSYAQAVKVEVIIIDKEDEIAGRSCIDDCVWPGDTNFDGIVNMEDLLPLGLAMGQTGPSREKADLSNFYGQYADNWDGDFRNAVNLKHLDTDGDSMVAAIDTIAISKFYGFTHDLVAVKLPTIQHQIKLKGKITANPGDLIELEMVLGEDNQPVFDVYGFTFPFSYNPDFFVPESVNINFTRDSWLAYNSPVLQMQKNDFLGLSEAGFTRTNALAASGHGNIGKLSVVVAEDLIGFRPDQDYIDVAIGGGVASLSNSAGHISGAAIGENTIRIQLRTPEEIAELPLTNDLLKVYPNPTHQLLNIHLNGQKQFEQLVIHNMVGQVVKNIGNLQTNRAQINVGDLENGFYILNVYTAEGVVNQKFEVIKD